MPVAIEAREFTMGGLIRAIVLARYAETGKSGISMTFRGFGSRYSHLRVNRVQVGLHSRLAVQWHAGELDAVAHSRIACAHHRRDVDVLRVQPEIHPQHGSERQRHHAFDVASIAAHVGSVDAQSAR